jgi:hypothetical protein
VHWKATLNGTTDLTLEAPCADFKSLALFSVISASIERIQGCGTEERPIVVKTCDTCCADPYRTRAIWPDGVGQPTPLPLHGVSHRRHEEKLSSDCHSDHSTPKEYLKETMTHIAFPRNRVQEVVTACCKALDKLEKQEPPTYGYCPLTSHHDYSYAIIAGCSLTYKVAMSIFPSQH